MEAIDLARRTQHRFLCIRTEISTLSMCVTDVV